MKYSQEEALRAARVLEPTYDNDKFELVITISENILGHTDEEKYSYRVDAIKKNGKKLWINTYMHSNISKALQSLMKTYGYCCGENIEKQEQSILAAYPKAIIVKEASEWDNVCKNLNKGDTLVYDRVSVMNNETTEAIKLYEYCYDREINLVFLKEPHLNIDTYRKAMESTLSDNGLKADIVSKALMNLIGEQIRIAIENPIKDLVSIGQRAKEDIKNAEKGKQVGQKKGTKLITKKSIKMKEIILSNSKDFNGTLSDLEMLEITKLARGTYYKYKRELK